MGTGDPALWTETPGTAQTAVRAGAGGHGETNWETRTSRARAFGKPVSPHEETPQAYGSGLSSATLEEDQPSHTPLRRIPWQALPRPKADGGLPPRPGPRDQASGNPGGLAPMHTEVPASLRVTD